MGRRWQTLVTASLLTGVAGAAGQVRLAVERVGQSTNFGDPIAVTQPPGETHRLYVVGHSGYIRVVRDGITLPTLFTSVPVNGGGSSEPGLLGFAFHPAFQSNGYAYASFNGVGPNSAQGIVIRRYTTDPTSPDQAIAGSEMPIFFVPRSAGIHNGGWLGFGPDGYLYLSLGESGQSALAQSPTSLLGKMLRIDVDHDDFPADSFQNYAIPPTNPFAASPTTLHEIWAVGLRNPWRCSFDRLTGDLWIGDVGEASSGEIDVQPATTQPPFTARNYGWPCMEGNSCHSPTGGCTCHDPLLTNPVYDEGRQGPATIGGYVYRGSAIPELQGTYIFADYGGLSWSFRYDGTSISQFVSRRGEIPVNPYSSLGEDSSGELYLCSLSGPVYKIIRGCYANCDASTVPPVLNVMDFNCFLNQFAAGDHRANCDASTEPPVLNVLDFDCFLNAFVHGCP